MKKILSILGLLLCSYSSFAQEYIPKNDGVKTNTSNYTAFTNAKIYITPTQVVDNATLLIKDGKVVASGTSVTIPKNAVTVDVSGKTIYPSFIETYSYFGMKPVENASSNRRSPQYDASREGYYWNDHIRPDQNALDFFDFDSKKAEKLRKAGFGVVNSHIDDGIIQGTGVLVTLAPEGSDATRLLDEKLGQFYGTSKSKTSRQMYPTSLMGTMALLRQVNLDADWYAKGNIKEKDRALEAFNANKNEIQILNASSKENVLRFDKIGDQFNTQYIFIAGGDEYEWIKDIKATNAQFIVPVNFPDAYDMEDPLMASSVSLADLKAWNQAPSNPKILADNNITFAFTTHDLKEEKDLLANLQKAIEYGLDKTKALEALTTIPAQIIGKSTQLGHLKTGAYANFFNHFRRYF